MGLYSELNNAGLLAIGLNPEWYDHHDVSGLAGAVDTGPPTNANAGIFLQGSPRALVLVRLREQVHRRTLRVQYTTIDLATGVYALTCDGVTINYDAAAETPANDAALLQGIVDGWNNDAGAAAKAAAAVEGTDTVVLRAVAVSDVPYDATITGGTGALTATADAVTGGARIWITPKTDRIADGNTGPTANDWSVPIDGDYAGLSYRGMAERYDVAGFNDLYVELYSLAGHGSDGGQVQVRCTARVGPAVE